MKQVFIISATTLFILFSSLVFSGTNQVNKELKTTTIEEFSVVGTTNHKFSKNYTISLRVVGNSTISRKAIDYVEHKDGNDWVRIPYYNVSYDKHVFYVMIDNENYYFTFDTSKQPFK